MFLPKFIHILSTNLTKCAIYKAKMFAFRLQYAHAHTYIYKDKYKCYLCSRAKCGIIAYLCRINVGYIPKITTTTKLTIFAK